MQTRAVIKAALNVSAETGFVITPHIMIPLVGEYCYKDEQKKSKRTQLEIDFVANKGSRRYYIQSALTVADEEKRAQEVNSLNRVGDSFKKIVVVKDNIIPWHDENGILYVGIEKFLLNETAMEL